MNFNGHFWGSIFIFSALYFIIQSFDILNFLLCGVIFVFFGLFPDIDTNSKIQDFIYSFLVCITVSLLVMKYFSLAAIIGFLALIPIASKHRGITHNILTGLIISAFIYISYDDLAFWSLSGFMTHIFLDLSVFSKNLDVI